MITIFFNDAIYQIDPTKSLQDFLMGNRCIDQHFAVAINNQHIPRGAYSTTWLQEGDRVDMIVPMQGG